MGGISFDRAARFYDRTRGLRQDQADQVTDVLAADLTGRGRCLEIGIGTGRIALPLHARGVDVVGLDLSAEMLAQLRMKPRTAALPVFVGDATTMPFADHVFGAVFACHVFHLLPQWRLVADEVVRVVRPGGTLLVDFGGWATSGGPWREIADDTFDRFGLHRNRPGITDVEPLAAYLGRRALLRRLPAIKVHVRRSLEQDLQDWEQQVHSWTWGYDAAVMSEACAAIRAEATRRRLPRVAEFDHAIQWWGFDF